MKRKVLHSIKADEAGWHKVHPSRRNLLNKGAAGSIGHTRKGTLGYRVSMRTGRAEVSNPRIGKVQPEAAVTSNKRNKPTLEYVMGDTSMGAAVNLPDTARPPQTDTLYFGLTWDEYNSLPDDDWRKG